MAQPGNYQTTNQHQTPFNSTLRAELFGDRELSPNNVHDLIIGGSLRILSPAVLPGELARMYATSGMRPGTEQFTMYTPMGGKQLLAYFAIRHMQPHAMVGPVLDQAGEIMLRRVAMWY